MLPTRVDQVEQGLSRLLSVLEEKENIEKLIEIYLLECQEIEDASLEFAGQKNIDTAEGEWLNYIGKIVGLERSGATDAEYRSQLLLQIQINSADGTPDTMTAIVRQFTTATNVRLRDFTIAASVLYTNGVGNLGVVLFDLVDQIKPAGVRIIIHTDETDTAMLPSWEIALPIIVFLEVTDPILPPPALDLLELFDGVSTEIMSVVTGLGGTFYRPDTTRSIPSWEGLQQLQGNTNNTLVDITGVSGGVGVDIEVFTSNSDSPVTLCWEVIDPALTIAY